MPWEQHLLLAIHSHHSLALDRLFLISRWFGNTAVLAVVVLTAAVVCAGSGNRRAALIWIGAGGATLGVGWGLKHLVGRIRPQLWPWLIRPGDSSFPSGHALGTAMVFTLLVSFAPKRYRRVALAAAGVLIVYVGFGRLYLGVHWPTDVLGGWALGLGIAGVARALRQGQE